MNCDNNKNKRLKISMLIRIFIIVTLTLVYSVIFLINENQWNTKIDSDSLSYRLSQRKILSVPDESINDNTTYMNNLSQVIVQIFNESYNKNQLNKSKASCMPPAIYEFPDDGLTRNERKHGLILVHLILACYCFGLLAIVCSDYFVPVIGIMCKKLHMKEDVAGATFMAAATSSPELFINSVGTFITKNDLGVGTVVGSAVFNVLAVPACCGLLAGQIIVLDWYPLCRDSLMYGWAVVLLFGVLYDGRVIWYEALILVLAYTFYLIAMYNNDWISDKARTMVNSMKRRNKRSRPYKEVTEISPLLSIDKSKISNGISTKPVSNGIAIKPTSNGHVKYDEIDSFNNNQTEVIVKKIIYANSPWRNDEDLALVFWIKWPITLLLWLTIPDSRKHPKLLYLTFSICILWIGTVSYIVAFLITIIGDTINIPDSVMGLTLLAAGTSLPEAVSSVIVTNQGNGGMGISNSIGSNTFDILLCLGLPWLVKSLWSPPVPEDYSIYINSAGLPYTVASLLSTLCGLFIAFAINKFRLDWKIGLTCTIMYIAFLIFASLIELNVFFPVNIPTCEH